MTRFVILAAPRTGSNLLCTLLNSHPDVLCHHELFNPDGIFYALNYRNRSHLFGDREVRDSDPDSFLQRVWSNNEGASCIGFKMTRGQHDAVMQGLIEETGILKIVLSRKNRLKTFVSEQMAVQSGQWEVYSSGELKTGHPGLRIDVESLKAHCDLNTRFYKGIRDSLNKTQQDFIEIVYEEIFSKPVHVRLLGFLGVKTTRIRLVEASVKQNDRDLRCLITNYQELEKSLVGSDHLAELYDCEY